MPRFRNSTRRFQGTITIQIPNGQIPGLYHRRIGDIVVIALSDGYLDGNLEVLQNIANDAGQPLLDANFRPGRGTSVNSAALSSPEAAQWWVSRAARSGVCLPSPKDEPPPIHRR